MPRAHPFALRGMQAFRTSISNFSPHNFMIGYLGVKIIVINKTTEEIASYVMLNTHDKRIHFVMTMVGPRGIRLVCLFLKLTGLDQFVAKSYGSQQKVSAAMEEAIVKYGEEEKQRFA